MRAADNALRLSGQGFELGVDRVSASPVRAADTEVIELTESEGEAEGHGVDEGSFSEVAHHPSEVFWYTRFYINFFRLPSGHLARGCRRSLRSL